MQGFYSPSELVELCVREGAQPDLVEGLVPQQAICLAAGESGVGKSPLLYQMAICVAAGLPFLGRQVKQRNVLYLDGENGARQLINMLADQACFLGVRVPENLTLYNWNLGGSRMPDAIPGAIKKFEAGLVIVDPLNAAWPNAEEDAAKAQETYMGLREIMAKQGCSFLLLHHLAKPTEARPKLWLEKVHPREWFKQVRGSTALINHADMRLGLDVAMKKGEGDVVLGGFGRISGAIPTQRLQRVFDGERPLGYQMWEGFEHGPVTVGSGKAQRMVTESGAADRMRG